MILTSHSEHAQAYTCSLNLSNMVKGKERIK